MNELMVSRSKRDAKILLNSHILINGVGIDTHFPDHNIVYSSVIPNLTTPILDL